MSSNEKEIKRLVGIAVNSLEGEEQEAFIMDIIQKAKKEEREEILGEIKFCPKCGKSAFKTKRKEMACYNEDCDFLIEQLKTKNKEGDSDE